MKKDRLHVIRPLVLFLPNELAAFLGCRDLDPSDMRHWSARTSEPNRRRAVIGISH